MTDKMTVKDALAILGFAAESVHGGREALSTLRDALHDKQEDLDAAHLCIREQILARADAFGCLGVADVMGLLRELGVVVEEKK